MWCFDSYCNACGCGALIHTVMRVDVLWPIQAQPWVERGHCPVSRPMAASQDSIFSHTTDLYCRGVGVIICHHSAFIPLTGRQGLCKLRAPSMHFGSDFTKCTTVHVYQQQQCSTEVANGSKQSRNHRKGKF